MLQHFWKESLVPDTLNEYVFGGLFQESFYCAECKAIEKHPIQRLPDVISISIKGITVQTNLDYHFTTELVEKRYLKCPSVNSWKSQEIIVCPSPLIIQLKCFTFNKITKVTKS